MVSLLDGFQDVSMLFSDESDTDAYYLNDDPTTVPFVTRSMTVADGTIRPTHVLHAPQPLRPCFDTISTASYSPVGNQAIGLRISRPPAPIFDQPQHRRALRTSYSNSSPIDHPNEHYSTHHCWWDNERMPCSHELQSNNILAHFHQHHRIDVDKEGSFTCSWTTPRAGCCGKKLKIDSLSRHITTHIGIKFKCSVCSKKMAARNDLAAKHRRHRPACSQATFDITADCNAPF